MSADDVAAWTGPIPAPPELGAVHLIGIGGAGMSGIARILLARGVPVSGSDRRDTPTVLALRALGARVEIGHAAAHVGDADTVVVSTAIRDDNAELVAARERGLRVLPRAVALAAVMAGLRSVAVAGTHGKTSTTSMLTVAVQACGADPSFAIGGDLNESGSNAHAGEGDVFVAEADESDRSFLLLAPFAAIVTNVEADHLDNYGDLAAVEAAFDRFLTTVDPAGFVVLCADDPGSARLAAAPTRARVRTYGREPGADLQLRDLEVGPAGTSWTAVLDGEELGRVEIRLPGAHMALNSAAALLAGLELGFPLTGLLAGLRRFGGVHRRFELRGVAAGVRVYDDYAHHPTEVTAQLHAARAVVGDGRLVVVFQPHLYSRTREFATAFGTALGLADEVVVMGVYGAREDPVPGVTGALVADAVPLPAGRVLYEPSWSAAAPAVAARARPGDLVITMGAGDVVMVGPEVLAALDGAGAEEDPR
ncbi:UDP-N-acetylmuramate--L-alanine ligase [Modestobacter sp. I12A-02628]|uniref:UDP-N-acetylmuramate--L-alanine ligase n=1 Tax=Goekera deserti TaxID=2497753 RepID=A0A7K3WBP6_9ACTN|nr:UDP-N-acetylmuramate--L-alanine ligase [Goekera deserti]MPQ99273.1 UDP-N-acetylmuramate--L-alanine ligase [Goekera deserti]NDI47608.1 UDP-N-acetylmuramate--L-alanine ligase [Goekera deserti]NDI47671.1 UDP-N-acetylmuramate--L-alanine ligase [Goekera deserti]NEL53419.1 UDP-N-acetylmuramate--L-alanine ligase [Goekera deserti]